MRTDKRNEYGNEVPLIYPGERLTLGLLNARIDRKMELQTAKMVLREQLAAAAATADRHDSPTVDEPFNPREPPIPEYLAGILESMELAVEKSNRDKQNPPDDPNMQIGWHNAICALLTHNSIDSAADACGIHPTTLRRWLGVDEFCRLFRTAQNKIIQSQVDDLLRLRHKATKRLEEALDTDDPAASARATRLLHQISHTRYRV